MRAGKRERRCVVVECCGRPIRGGVACGAGCREANSGVGRGVGAVVILLVATVACGGQGGVVVIDVA